MKTLNRVEKAIVKACKAKTAAYKAVKRGQDVINEFVTVTYYPVTGFVNNKYSEFTYAELRNYKGEEIIIQEITLEGFKLDSRISLHVNKWSGHEVHSVLTDEGSPLRTIEGIKGDLLTMEKALQVFDRYEEDPHFVMYAFRNEDVLIEVLDYAFEKMKDFHDRGVLNRKQFYDAFSCVLNKAESVTELDFYFDVFEWLADELTTNQVYLWNLNWDRFIEGGAPIDNKTHALFLLSPSLVFGNNYYYTECWHELEYQWGLVNGVVDIRKNNVTKNGLTYQQYLLVEAQSYAPFNGYAAEKELLKQGKDRLFKGSKVFTKSAPHFKLHSLGLGKFFNHVKDPFSYPEKDILDFLKAVEVFEKAEVPLDIKGLVLPKYLTIKEVLKYLTGAIFFGKEAINLSSFDLLHIEVKHPIVIPNKFKKEISLSSNLIDWIINKNIINNPQYWEQKSARLVVIAGIMDHLQCDFKTAEIVFVSPAATEAVIYANNNKPVEYHTLPEIRYEINGLVLEPLEKSDVRNLYIGELTSCCQKLGGHAESTCTEGWTDPNSLNYVFRKGETILAHMWVFKTQEGNLVIDSIEGKQQVSVADVAYLVDLFADSVNCAVLLSNTEYGVTKEVIKQLNLTDNDLVAVGKPCLDYSYLDVDLDSAYNL